MRSALERNPRKTSFEGNGSQNLRCVLCYPLFKKKLISYGNWLYNKSTSDNNAFVRQCKLQAQHQKSAWSFKIYTLDRRQRGEVCCGGFFVLTEQMLSLVIERSWGQCVSCAFQHWFPVDFVCDRIWPLKHFREFFDLFWSKKFLIAAKWPFNKKFSFSSLE